MAKIITSAFIDGLKGSLQGSTFRTMKRGVHIFTKGRPANPRSDAQTTHRTRMSSVNAAWQNLTADEKALWSQFATQSRGEPTGYHAFMELNLNLLSSDNVSLTTVTNPPLSPNTPPGLLGLFAQEYGNTTTALCWLSPNLEGVFVKSYVGIISGSKVRWRLLSTVLSTALFACHNYNYPTGTVLGYKARCILTDGRQGPYAFTSQSPLPFVPGVIGDPSGEKLCLINTTPLSTCFKVSLSSLTPGSALQPKYCHVDFDHIVVTSRSQNMIVLLNRFTLIPIMTYSNDGRPENEQLSSPEGAWSDDDYIYSCSKLNHIFKIEKSSGNLILDYTPSVGGLWDGFTGWHITGDDTYIWVSITAPGNTFGVIKLQKSDMTVVNSSVGYAFGNGLIRAPLGLCVAGDYLFTATGAYNLVLIHNKNTMAYISELVYSDYAGSIYNYPRSIDFDENFLYTLNMDSEGGIICVFKHDAVTFEVIESFGSHGNGSQQFGYAFEISVGKLSWQE